MQTHIQKRSSETTRAEDTWEVFTSFTPACPPLEGSNHRTVALAVRPQPPTRKQVALLQHRRDLYSFSFSFSLSISLSLFRVSQIWITTSWQRGIFKSHRQAMPLKKTNNKKPKKYKKTQDWSVVLWSLLIICVLKAIGRSQDSLKRRLKWEKIIWSLQGCRFVLHKSLYPFPLNCEGGKRKVRTLNIIPLSAETAAD